MFLSRLAVRRFIGVLMVVGVIAVVGLVSMARLPMNLLPDMQLPMVMVLTGYEGASPQEVETMVTRPIEEVLSTMSDLQGLTSSSTAAGSMVTASFNWTKNMDMAATEVREKLDYIRNLLPEDASDPITIQMDPSMLPIMQVGVSAALSADELTRFSQQVVKPRLERIDGVAVVSVIGGSAPRILIEVDYARLAAYDISLENLSRALFLENLNYLGGELDDGAQLYQVRTIGQFRSSAEIKEVIVGYNQAGAVTLGQVAAVREELYNDKQLSRLDGEPSIILSIRKRTDANTVQVAQAVKRELDKLEQELAGEVVFAVSSDQSLFIRDSIMNLAQIALIGGLLAALLVFLFLGSVSATAVISCAIPLSMLATFTLIYFQKFTLNIITLGGLALGVGMMVDNSIVILENIYRLGSQGIEKSEASILGAGRMIAPITAATLTSVIVFLPVFFIEGIVKIIFVPLAYTVTFSLLASLFVAITVVPSLSARLPVRPPAERGLLAVFNRGVERLTVLYRRGLLLVLRRPGWPAGAVVVLLLASLALIGQVGAEFIPKPDSSELLVEVGMPAGTSLRETERAVILAEGLINAVPEIRHISAAVGSSDLGFTGSTPNRATLNVLLLDKSGRNRSIDQVAEEIRLRLQEVPGATITVSPLDVTGSNYLGGGIKIVLKGEQLVVLEKLAREAAARMEPLAGTREVRTSFDEGNPELQIRLDRARAANLGVSTPLVGTLVELALQGKLVTRMQAGGREVDVYLRGDPAMGCDSAALEQLVIVTPLGTRVPLSQVATVGYDLGPISINREGQSRVGYVTAQVAAGHNLRHVSAEVKKALADLELPPGYSLDYGGDLADMESSFRSLAFAILFAVVLVYMILAAQFESLLYPFIIMFSLPQALTGVIMALYISGYTLSVVALIGVILLAGIVVNNGIILVDYINYLRREEGYALQEALLEAGATRLRPILMTTGTTVLGTLPLALGFGPGAEVQAPLAAVVVGGLTFSTLITLFVVPAVYKITDQFGDTMKGILKQRRGEAAVTFKNSLKG
ncbi:MAG: efflux RND transporter permease subunit [Bacillota bacterium]